MNYPNADDLTPWQKAVLTSEARKGLEKIRTFSGRTSNEDYSDIREVIEEINFQNSLLALNTALEDLAAGNTGASAESAA